MTLRLSELTNIFHIQLKRVYIYIFVYNEKSIYSSLIIVRLFFKIVKYSVFLF